jgi:hypothetical protein
MSSRRLFAVALAGALALPAAASAQNPGEGETPGTARNFTLVGHEPLLNRGMNAAAALYHNFLYVGNRTDVSAGHPHPGVLVVNVARPKHPKVVTELPPEPLGQTSRELRVWPQQKLLMVMLFRCSAAIHACPAQAPSTFSIKFYDLTDPVHPQLVSTYVPSRQPHEMFLWVDPNRPGRALLYLSTPTSSANPSTPNLVVTDISRWRENVFTEIVRYTANPLFTAQQRADLDVALHSMFVTDDGTRTHLSHLGGGFFVLDTSDLANAVATPQVRLLTPIAASPRWTNQTVHSSIPIPGRPYSFTTDELYGDLLDNSDNDHGCPWGWAHVIDVSDPANPRLLSEFRTNANTPSFCSTPAGQDDLRASYTAHNPTAFRDVVLVSWHGGGLQAVALENPAAPTQGGFFTPTPLASVATEDPALTTTGNKVAVWTFPIVKNGYVYVGDIRNGLYVLRYTGPAAEQVNGAIFREGNSNLTEACPVATVSPRRVTAGRRATIRVSVRLFDQPVLSAFVRLRGAVSRGAVTDATGDVALTVRPRKRGTIRVEVTNVASQCVERITVRPQPRRPRPPRPAGDVLGGGALTGRN